MKNFVLVLAAVALAAANPVAAEYKCFYGNLHAHTHNSDGVSTPDSAYAYARDVAQVDVEGLTEHNKTGSRGDGTAYNFTDELYQLEKQSAANATVPGRFVALAGFEIGSEGASGFGHICVWNPPHTSPAFVTRADLQSCYQWITDQRVPAQYNHPGAGSDNIFNNLHYYPEYDQTMDMMEMFNSNWVYEDHFFQALQNGWRIGVSANQDNHNRDWGNRVNNLGNIPLTGIWADTLTQQAILDALMARRTFAAVSKPGDRLQLTLTVDGHWMGEKYQRSKGSVNIVVNARAQRLKFNRLNLYSDGVLIDTMGTTQTIVRWDVSKEVGVGSHYFTVKAMQDSGGIAWSSPVYVEVPLDDKEHPVVTWPTPVVDGARIVFVPITGVNTIKVTIYNLAGTRIWQTVSTDPSLAILWNGNDQRGNPVANGIYYILVEQSSASQTTISKGKTMVSR
jgi:hypothetical protein